MPPKPKAAGKGRAPAKRKLAEEFPPGEVLTDTGKKSWKLGAPIGKGGFGLIYLGKSSHLKEYFILQTLSFFFKKETLFLLNNSLICSYLYF